MAVGAPLGASSGCAPGGKPTIARQYPSSIASMTYRVSPTAVTSSSPSRSHRRRPRAQRHGHGPPAQASAQCRSAYSAGGFAELACSGAVGRRTRSESRRMPPTPRARAPRGYRLQSRWRATPWQTRWAQLPRISPRRAWCANGRRPACSPPPPNAQPMVFRRGCARRAARSQRRPPTRIASKCLAGIRLSNRKVRDRAGNARADTRGASMGSQENTTPRLGGRVAPMILFGVCTCPRGRGPFPGLFRAVPGMQEIEAAGRCPWRNERSR